ncbi:hypothetical protein HM1_0002 [Heliomicrobium modesticaldum Ice1]|uniref:Uncharacterized protein n=1 Tax=Heliobacterium modesticaldum (strain ATCC 51547 / Ice1) TaxID=498761 RepID=B0THV4_HELMI|nr:hypothetical protein HM1_0002 [Heliomicrobium modesticaldum Ice1]
MKTAVQGLITSGYEQLVPHHLTPQKNNQLFMEKLDTSTIIMQFLLHKS